MATKTEAVRATAQLSEEHQNILKVIVAARAECGRVAGGAAPDEGFFRKAVDFIRGYADRFHHAKEEDILFPELGEPGVRMHCDPLEEHIYKEDDILYPMAEEWLGEARSARLAERFAEVDRKFAGTVREHLAFAAGLT
jgi:hemerythrin-like domain-containing protein